MGKRARRRERDLMVEAVEIEALSLECDCGARIELPFDSELRKDGACPCCGRPVAAFEPIARSWRKLLRAIGSSRDVRFRLRLLRQLPP